MKYIAILLLTTASIFSNAQSPTYCCDDLVGKKGWVEVKPKTDTVKGYIEYYELEKYNVRAAVYEKGVHTLKWVETKNIRRAIDPAIAIYDVTQGIVPCPDTNSFSCLVAHWGNIKTLSKILVNGKEFDLKKHFTFIEEDKITNQP